MNYFWVISLKTKPLVLGCTRSFRAVWEMIIRRANLGVWLWGWQPQHHHPLKVKKLIQGCSISENKFIFKALYLVIYFSQQCSLAPTWCTWKKQIFSTMHAWIFKLNKIYHEIEIYFYLILSTYTKQKYMWMIHKLHKSNNTH